MELQRHRLQRRVIGEFHLRLIDDVHVRSIGDRDTALDRDGASDRTGYWYRVVRRVHDLNGDRGSRSRIGYLSVAQMRHTSDTTAASSNFFIWDISSKDLDVMDQRSANNHERRRGWESETWVGIRAGEAGQRLTAVVRADYRHRRQRMGSGAMRKSEDVAGRHSATGRDQDCCTRTAVPPSHDSVITIGSQNP